ncbi:MAG TPA: hypothetical protein VH592_19055 [Gemmataceae bacterium]|jgi:hypothetical protein
MSDTKPKADKNWVEHWRRLGPILEAIRQEELRNFNYEEQLPIIDALLQLGLDHAVPRPTSGLVELERLLAKGRR